MSMKSRGDRCNRLVLQLSATRMEQMNTHSSSRKIYLRRASLYCCLEWFLAWKQPWKRRDCNQNCDLTNRDASRLSLKAEGACWDYRETTKRQLKTLKDFQAPSNQWLILDMLLCYGKRWSLTKNHMILGIQFAKRQIGDSGRSSRVWSEHFRAWWWWQHQAVGVLLCSRARKA